MSKVNENRESEVLDQVQQLLESLKGGEKSFLFVTSDHSFAMSGNPIDLLSELSVAMVRYPVVRRFIMTAAANYYDVEKNFGDRIRDIKMKFCKQENSGNDGN